MIWIHDLRHFVQNKPLLQTLQANLSQSGWNIKISPHHMTIEMMCTDGEEDDSLHVAFPASTEKW